MFGKLATISAAGVGLISANYLHQFQTGANYDVAYDRSFFQVIAIISCVVILLIFDRKPTG